jgi:probable addiction module antidote protein
MNNLTPFDAVDFLDSQETVIAYLTAALEDENPDVFIAAIGDVARLHGMADISKTTGLGRESLYKSLRSGSKTRFETVRKVTESLGLKFVIETAAKQAS